MKSINIINKNGEYSFTLKFDNIDENFNNNDILIEPNLGFASLYDGESLNLYRYEEFELPEQLFINRSYQASEILSKKTEIIDNFIYFYYFIKDLDGRKGFFYIKIDYELNHADVSDLVLFDDLLRDLDVFNIKDEIFLSEIYTDRKIKIRNLVTNEVYTYDLLLLFDEANFKNLCFLNDLRQFNDDMDYYEPIYEYDINSIPYFICDTGNNSSMLLFINFIDKEIVKEELENIYFKYNMKTGKIPESIGQRDVPEDDRKVFSNAFIFKDDAFFELKFSYKIYNKPVDSQFLSVSDENYFTEIKIYDKNNNTIKVTNSLHDLDTELVINSGSYDSEETTKVLIKSNAPSFRDKNRNKFFVEQMKDDIISGVTMENENVNLNSVDNNELENNITIINNEEIFDDNYLPQNKLLDNTDTDNPFNHIDNRESVLVQEISVDYPNGLVFELSKNVTGNTRNKVVLGSTQNRNDNISIIIEGKNKNSVNSSESNGYKIIHTNSCALPPSRNNKYIFPFINSVNLNIEQFSDNKEDRFTAQKLFFNYVQIYGFKKDNDNLLFNDILSKENSLFTKLLLCSYIENSLGHDELDNIKDNSQYMKTICETLSKYKNDIIDTELELLSDNIEKDSIFKYITEYGSYKFKNQ